MASNWEKALTVLEPLFTAPLVSGRSKTKEAAAREAALGGPPEFQVPSSYDQYTSLLKERAGQQMPGYDDMSSDIQQQAAANATGVTQLTSGPEAVMGINSVYNNQANQLRDLGMRASQWQQEQEMRYLGAQQGRGELEQQQFEYNQWLPWQIQKNEIASLRGAGNQMVASGMDNLGAGAVNIVSQATSNVGT
jgi:hypothetical protein